MRAILVGVALGSGCALPHPPALPHPEPVFPIVPTYTSRIVDLRSTLGRSGIGLEVRGVETEVRTSWCDAGVDTPGCTRCELAGDTDPIDLDVIAAITAAFDRYPTTLLDAANIEHVTLCTNLERAGHIASGSELAGTADPSRHRMLISLHSFAEETYDPFADHTVEDIVHHELFHLLDFEQFNNVAEYDPAWRALNPDGFAYRDPAEGDDRPSGFVMVYGTTDEMEDRATVYTYLMARPTDLCAIAASDPIVRAKTQLIWARIVALEGGDELLRRRAGCVGWIDRDVARPIVVRRVEPKQRQRTSQAPTAETTWLTPPTSPHVLE